MKILLVEIDSDLSPIVPDYLDNRRKDCDRIMQYLNSRTFDDIKSLGHKMKGAGGSYGFDEISEIGEQLENAAETENDAEIVQLVKRLEDYLASLTVMYI